MRGSNVTSNTPPGNVHTVNPKLASDLNEQGTAKISRPLARMETTGGDALVFTDGSEWVEAT